MTLVVALPTLERRAGDRFEMDVTLTCRVPASPVPAKILDLSHEGCRIGFRNLHLELGGSITLELANGDRVAGEIVWSHGSVAGVRFHRRLRSSTAIFLGIEQPSAVEPEVVPSHSAPSDGLISHWYRRLTSAFSAAPRA